MKTTGTFMSKISKIDLIYLTKHMSFNSLFTSLSSLKISKIFLTSEEVMPSKRDQSREMVLTIYF